MKNRRTYVLAFCGVAIAMNIVLGIITSAIGIPLYMDTLGTVLAAALIGPVPGMIVGLLSNVITGLIYSVQDIPFALVNVVVGLIVGLVMSLVEGGKTIFQASFIRNIASNLIDKVGTCIIGWAILRALPMSFKSNFDKAKA